jgi:hypothetical protein
MPDQGHFEEGDLWSIFFLLLEIPSALKKNPLAACMLHQGFLRLPPVSFSLQYSQRKMIDKKLKASLNLKQIVLFSCFSTPK